MSYKTPHDAREYLFGACLCIGHDFVLRCQRRSTADKKALLTHTREVDLCGRIANYFGPSAHLAAQGIGTHQGQDLEVEGPTIRAEVKYFRPPARAWTNLTHDWTWLLGVANSNSEFRKRAWVVFWPSTSSGMFAFTNCLSVSRSHGNAFSSEDFAPFVPYTEVEMPANGQNQRLRFNQQPPQSSVIIMPQGKRVRCDIVGAVNHPIWAAIYTRVTPTEAKRFPQANRFQITGDALPNP